MIWATDRRAASMASASPSFVTIYSAECPVRFVVQSLLGKPGTVGTLIVAGSEVGGQVTTGEDRS